MNILITGSEGFIGKHLQDYLKTNIDCNLLLIDRKLNKEVLDISEQRIIDSDIIIHLAALTSVWNKDNMLIENDNIRSFIYLFDLCKTHNKRFIYASSSCSINITSMYGLSKHFDDTYAEMNGWDKCIGLRFHNVYGPNSRENTLAGICLANDEVTLYNNGNNIRHFTYIDDICKSVVKAFELEQGLYNICNPNQNTTLEFCLEINKYKKLNIKLIPDLRELDKVELHIDNSHINLIENDYIDIKEGIEKMIL